MFSSRTAWDRAENPLSRAAADARRAGGVLDLTETNPTAVGLAAPADVFALLGDAASAFYEPFPAGWRPARDAVAAGYARRGARVPPGRIVLTASTSEAYAHAFTLLCDPGDAVLVPRPSYPLFQFLGDVASVELVPYPLAYDGSWHLRVSDVAAARTARTRALVVVSPNNPTGSYLKRGEWEELRALCALHGLAVISDEVFADYPLRPDPERLTTLAAETDALVFALGGLSKSCGLPQLKLGWMAVAGPGSLRDEALARLELLADTFLSVSTPVQRAAPAILARAEALRAPIHARVAANLDALRGALRGSPATVLDLEGGWSAVVRLPATRTEDAWVHGLLAEEKVLVHPGYFFDFPHEAYAVLSLLPEADTFAEGVARLRRAVDGGHGVRLEPE
jgi:aspartate/methionine/tyrosine aminotransferase